MASPEGLIGPPMIDGVTLRGAVLSAEDFGWTAVRSTTEMATGGTRNGIHYRGAEYPMEKRIYRVVFRYSRLPAAILDTIEELLSVPVVHEVVPWKATHSTYAATGSRSAFKLPWYVATHFYTPPTVLPGDRFQGLMRVDPPRAFGAEKSYGSELTVLTKSSVDYAAGSPGAGEAWVVDRGVDFKLASAPAAGYRIVVTMLPIFSMNQSVAVSKQLQGQAPMVEPRSIELSEAAT